MNDQLIQVQRDVERFRANEDLEDVLNESMADFENNQTYDTIIKWIRRFPQYADKIFDYVEILIICMEMDE